MAVATAPAPVAAAHRSDSPPLHAFEVWRDERAIMELVAYAGDGGEVRVETEINPVNDRDPGEPERRSYVFATREQAKKFVDETMIAFEYLNCTINDRSLIRS